jgi:hypothetical protein
MSAEQDAVHRWTRLGEVAWALSTSIAPKAGAVLAGIGLYVLVADSIGFVNALVGPLDLGRPDLSLVGVVAYVAPVLVAVLTEFFGAPMFAGWLSGTRGWLYGLVTALFLSFPETALALWALTMIPLDSFGDFGGLLTVWPWVALASIPRAWCVIGLFVLPPCGALLLAALAGSCGERLRLHRRKEADA